MAWPHLLAFLAARAIPGVEVVDAGRYRRVIDLDGRRGWLHAVHRPSARAVEVTSEPADLVHSSGVIDRVRRLFDLDADPRVVAAHFQDDDLLGPSVRRLPGLRVPGAWDGFELGVRAILGQQVTVKGASTLAGRLVAVCGQTLPSPAFGLTHSFPQAADLAVADLSTLGVPVTRRESLRAFAAAVSTGAVSWETASLEADLRSLPGFGDWTAQYILMRACHDPDAFPASDLWLRRAAGTTSVRALVDRAEHWRPWRAYAAMHLWQRGVG